MIMKYLCFLLAFMGNTLCTHGQIHDQVKEASFQNEERFEQYIESYLNTKTPQGFKQLCLTTCVFIKFRVDKIGNVKDLAFNISTSDKLKPFIREAILSTNGKWKPGSKKGKPIISRYYLLPVVVQLSSKCIPKDESANGTYKMLMFEETPKRPDGLNLTKLVEPLDCIVLNPVMLLGPTH